MLREITATPLPAARSLFKNNHLICNGVKDAFDFLKTAFNYFLFSSLFIALVTTVMVYQTATYFHLQFDFRSYIAFSFFATICSYNFHWVLTPEADTQSIRVSWTMQHRWLHWALIILGALGAAWYVQYLLPHWRWILLAVLLTFLYSAPKISFPAFTWLRNIAVGKTIFLSFVWTYVSTVLPIAIATEHWSNPEILFCIARFFFIYPICILFDYRDREDDRRHGIRSMITYFNETGITRLFYGCLLLYFVTIVLLFKSGFSAWQLLNLALQGVVAACLYPYSRKNFSDYHYYFVLDGLMMMAALITLIFGI